MLRPTNQRQIRAVAAAFLLATLPVVIACGGSSPTQPTMPAFTGAQALSGQSVISGVVTGGGGLSAEGLPAAAISPSNVQVNVEGTSISSRTDAQGRFRLVNVPSGTVRVRFNSSETDAMLTVPAVGDGQHVALTVQLQANSASIAADVREALTPFESLVVSVVLSDSQNGTVTLADGTVVVVDAVTWWDTGGDYFNLTDLRAAVLAGQRVEARGQGTLDPSSGQLLASVIRAAAIGELFAGIVQSASGLAPDGTIVLVANLEGGVAQVRVDAATVWDPDGDLLGFAELLAAFAKGLWIEVEGHGELDATGTFILAGEIGAVLAEREFEGIVASAAGVAPDGTINLVDNDKGPITTIRVDADTVWEGDASSLTELIALLSGPFPVKVEGEGWLALDETFILATRIEVKVEDDLCDGRYATQIAALSDLISLVHQVAQANGLNGGQTNSLTVKLSNATSRLESCHSTPAVNMLGAFINQVNAFIISGRLNATDGALLIANAQAIIDSIRAVE